MNTRAFLVVLAIVVALGIVARFTIFNSQSTTSFPSSSIAQGNNAFSPKPLSIDALSLLAPSAPLLEKAEAQCSGTNVTAKLSWSTSPGALDYGVYRDEVPIGRVSGNSYEDTGLVDTARHCYTVRSRGQDSTFGSVLSEASNRKCVSAKDCSKFAGKPPVGGVPPPGATNTPTPTPTKKLTPTPTPTDARCRSTTVAADGKPVISVKAFDDNIQAALDCFKDPASGGGAVYIPTGTYTITEKIRIYSNVTLFGDGIDKTILQATSSFSDTMIGNDSSRGQQNIAIREMTLNGGLDAIADLQPGFDGIRLRDLVGGYIYKVKVERFGDYGIWLSYKPTSEAPGYKAVYDFRVSECQSLRNKGKGIWIDSGERNVVDSCIVSAEGDANGIGFEIGIEGKLSNNRMIANDIQRNGHGITLTAGNFDNYTPAMINSNNIVCYNIVKNNLGPGVWDQHGKDNVYIGNVIANNNNNDGHNDVINVDSFGYEEKLPPARDPRCDIPASYSIPQAPPKVLGAATRQVSGEEEAILDSPFARIANFFESFVLFVQKLSGGTK